MSVQYKIRDQQGTGSIAARAMMPKGKGIFEVQLLWTRFEEDGGWFFGNVDFPTLD